MKNAKELWKELSNIPVNCDGEIQTDWHIFYKGTDRQYIWGWLESRYNLSVRNDLMGTEYE